MTPHPVIARSKATKQSSQTEKTGAADHQPSNTRRSHPRHCERSTSPQGAGRHAVAVPSGMRDWPQANKAISPMQLEKNWFAAQLRRPHNEYMTQIFSRR